MSYLEVQSLSKAFGPFQALNQLSLSSEKGQITCIVGPSGGGKSTLLRCLNGLETADSGQVLIDGEPIADHRAFGLVFQQFELFPQYTALENIILAPLRQKLAPRKELEERALKLLRTFDLESHKDAYPYQLSGGQRQRVALARALILDPRILCLDEPTSALDPDLTDTVAQLVLDLKAQGMTLLVVTHDLPFAEQIADALLWIEEGRVVPEKSRTATRSTSDNAVE